MAELVTVATIKLHDQLTGGMKAMAGHAMATGTKLQNAFNNFRGIGHAVGGGIVGTAMGTFFLNSEKEYDQLRARFQAQSELNDGQLSELEAKLARVSNDFGISRKELLEAAQGWKEAGASVDDFTRSLENYAKVSKITGTSVKETALESRGLMLAFGMNVADPKAVKEMEEFFLVASKNIKGGAHALIEVFKSAAPIAGVSHMSKELLAGLASAGVAGGFQSGEIGRALKTFPLRLAAPTPKARAAMRANGIDIRDLYGIDEDKLQDNIDQVSKRLAAAGLKVGPGLTKHLSSIMLNADDDESLDQVKDRMIQAIAKSLSLGKGDAQNRKVVAAAIDQYFTDAARGINWDVLAQNANLGLGFWEAVVGKEHAAKIIEILKNWKLATYVRDNVAREAPGAIERKAAIAFRGFSFEVDRAARHMENFWGTLAASGVKSDLANIFQGISNAIERLSKADEKVFRGGFWTAAGLAALPIAAFGVRSMASAIGLFGGAAVTAGAGGLVLLRGIGWAAAWPFMAAATGIRSMAMATALLGLTSGTALGAAGRLGGLAGLMAGMGAIARFAGPFAAIGGAIALYQNWESVTAFFSKLGASPELGKLGTTLGEIAGNVTGIASNIGNLAAKFLELFGVKVEGGTLFGGLENLLSLIDRIAQALNAVVGGLNILSGGKIAPKPLTEKEQQQSVMEAFQAFKDMRAQQEQQKEVKVDSESIGARIAAAVQSALQGLNINVNVPGAGGGAGSKGGAAAAAPVTTTNGAGYGGR